MERKTKNGGFPTLKIAVVVAQDRNGSVIARIAGRGRPKADEIDMVIGEYIHPSALLLYGYSHKLQEVCQNKGAKAETVNERQKQRGCLFLLVENQITSQ